MAGFQVITEGPATFRFYQLLSAGCACRSVTAMTLSDFTILPVRKSSTNSLKFSVFGYEDGCACGGRNFRRNICDGDIRRNSFRPWEIDILIGIESCDFGDVSKQNMLRRYQNAVRRQMEKGARLPLRLSEYMELLRIKRTQPKTRV